jgi:signal transduction histidine kinase
VTGQHRSRPATLGVTDPGDASARAEALLRATNEFLRADDLPALGRAITEATLAMFGESKAAATLVRQDGSMALMSTTGFAPEEIERLDAVVVEDDRLLQAVVAGRELWSDDADAEDVRERVAAWRGGSGLSIPIRTTTGVAGIFSILFAEDRTFDPGFRDAIRSLAAQAGLAHELIAARDDLRRAAADAEAQRRIATAFFDVATRLATVTDEGGVSWALVGAICAATRAATAGVALRVGDTEEFRISATAGVSPEQAAILASMPITPDNYPDLRALLDGQVLAGVDRSEMGARLDLGGGVAAPIIADDKVRGFLSITVAPGDSFDFERWHELAMGFASVAATAISRVEALAELRDQRELLASSVAERTLQLRGAIEELRNASQAKTDFLANVSHELRTPLTAILGFSEVLIRGDDGPLNPRQYEDMTTVLSSGRRLLDLIDDLIDISRIEGDRLELDMQPLDLGPLLSGVVEELRALAGAKGIGLTFTQAPDPMTVVADRVRLQEVFLNLVSNAVKFTQPGGTVRVAAGIEAPADPASSPMVRIDVIDTGIGVPEEERERIFEKFHRIAGPEYPGTGLGLSIARELVIRHGGTLALASTVGLGSRFSVLFPLAAAQAR